jgi:hypothetical protein
MLRTAGNIFSLLILVVVLIGAYVSWRYWEAVGFSSDSTAMSFGQMMTMVEGKPPFFCTAQVSNFHDNESAKMFISGSSIRVDRNYKTQGHILHGIFTQPSNAYVWWDNQETGCLFTNLTDLETNNQNQFSQQIEGALSNNYSCEPWWSPDQSLFKPPTSVLFDDCSAK